MFFALFTYAIASLALLTVTEVAYQRQRQA